ncbi:MAG: diaminopimelate epimerase [Coriobacteriales bacterium]|jgi:diaminopimelate epimerase|nr:diaminopimelate epimerase [Coriobacteriales bacterium]
MQLDFIKMHGAGNDFIMVDDLSSGLELTAEQVARLCDRHFGIGADGVILVRPSQHASCAAYMHYLNADGSLAEMCGNGVRCFAKFLVDGGYVAANLEGGRAGSFIADTLAGRRTISFRTDADGKLSEATVDMGQPLLAPEQIPTTLSANSARGAVLEQDVPTPFGDLALSCVNMGNPHAVIFSEEFAANPAGFALEGVGAWLEQRRELFPEKVNAEFAALTGPERLTMRVFERGVGETLACGTGACATAVAGVLTGRCGRRVEIALPGGVLQIYWREKDDHVLMTGPATTVFEGTIVL